MLLTLGYGLGSFLCFLFLLPNRLSHHQKKQNELEGMLLPLLLDLDMEQVIGQGGMQV